MIKDFFLTFLAAVSAAFIFYFSYKGAVLAFSLFNIIGVFLILAGGVFWIWAFFTLGRYLNPGIEPKSPELLTHGPFSVVRHPIYFGASLLFIGMVFIGGGYRSLPFLALILYVEILKARLEEEALLKKFPEYIDYKKKVGFLFPRFRNRSV